MAFGRKAVKSGGKTRKIRPSGDDLCSFRRVAGRSVQDCGKVVQKLAGREDENYKLCTTLCAPLRLGTRIVQVSFPLGVWCVGVVVRRCAIRSFSLPPAEPGFPFRRRGRGRRQAVAGRAHGSSPINGRGRGRRQAVAGRTHGASPISGQGRGRRQVAAGRAHGQGRGWPAALPPLRTVIRHTSGIVRHASGIVRHPSGILRHASGIVRHASCIVRHTSGSVRHCTRGRPPLPSPSPTLRTAARATVPQRREGEPYIIIYTRAQARGRERFAQGGEQRCG